MFFHFECHTSDGNDNSIVDVVVEESSLEEAEALIERELKGWESDQASENLEFKRDVGQDRTYFKTFFLQGEHEDISTIERCGFHGYEEYLKSHGYEEYEK